MRVCVLRVCVCVLSFLFDFGYSANVRNRGVRECIFGCVSSVIIRRYVYIPNIAISLLLRLKIWQSKRRAKYECIAASFLQRFRKQVGTYTHTHSHIRNLCASRAPVKSLISDVNPQPPTHTNKHTHTHSHLHTMQAVR